MPSRSSHLCIVLTEEVLDEPSRAPAALLETAFEDGLTELDESESPLEEARSKRHGLHITDALPPGPLLPSQFFAPFQRPIHKRGVGGLMVAILEDAIQCFQWQFVRNGRNAQRAGAEATAWLFCNDEKWIFSFVNICAALDLEPRRIQDQLLKWQEQHTHPIVTTEPEPSTGHTLKK